MRKGKRDSGRRDDSAGVELIDETDAPPFCSERCRLIDLGRWLDEEVSVPHEGGPTKGEAVDTPTELDP